MLIVRWDPDDEDRYLFCGGKNFAFHFGSWYCEDCQTPLDLNDDDDDDEGDEGDQGEQGDRRYIQLGLFSD